VKDCLLTLGHYKIVSAYTLCPAWNRTNNRGLSRLY